MIMEGVRASVKDISLRLKRKSETVNVGRLGARYYQDGGSLFGLTHYQSRMTSGEGFPHAEHNAGWYNGVGDRLGWGDLAYKDITNVAEGLEEGEIFIVLPEHPSRGWLKVKPEPFNDESPGIDFLSRHADYIVVKGQVYVVKKNRAQLDSEDVYSGDISKHYEDVIDRLKKKSDKVGISQIDAKNAKNTILDHQVRVQAKKT